MKNITVSLISLLMRLSSHSGIIPRLLGDALSLWICNMLAHFINTYAIDDSVRKHTQTHLSVFVSSLHSVLIEQQLYICSDHNCIVCTEFDYPVVSVLDESHRRD